MESERERFYRVLRSSGLEPEDLEPWKVAVQSERIDEQPWTLLAYGDLRTPEEGPTRVVSTEDCSCLCFDIRRLDRARLMTWLDEDDRELAILYVGGILSVIDFYHDGVGRFPVLRQILREAKELSHFWGDPPTEIIRKEIHVVRRIEELDEEELKELRKRVARALSYGYETRLGFLERRIGELEEELKLQEERKSLEVQRMIKVLLEYPDWEPVISGFRYRPEIYVQRVRWKSSLVVLPQPFRELYVAGLTVRIRSDGSLSAFAERACHPNVSSGGQVCMGDLEGKGLQEVLQNLPEVLTTANLDSAWSDVETIKIAEKLWMEQGSQGRGSIFQTSVFEVEGHAHL